MKKNLLISALLLPALLSVYIVNGQTIIDFESETVGSYGDVPGVSQATSTFSGYDFTAISTTNAGIYYGIDKDNPSTYPETIGYNSTYFYMGTDVGDPLKEFDITKTGGGLFDFNKATISPMPSTYLVYNTPFDVYIQGFKAGTAVTSKIVLSTVVRGAGGYDVPAKFDVSANADFKGIDKVIVTFSIPLDYVAIDNIQVEAAITTPVGLEGFSGHLNHGIANFAWQSGVEADLNHYELQKSLDTKSFTTVQTIPAKGAGQNYQANATQLEQTAYYRLKLVSNTGILTYSDIKTVTDASNNLNSTVYPNPATDFLYIDLESPAPLSIYDISGKQVLHQALQQGHNKIAITALTPGVYVASVNGKRMKFIKK